MDSGCIIPLDQIRRKSVVRLRFRQFCSLLRLQTLIPLTGFFIPFDMKPLGIEHLLRHVNLTMISLILQAIYLVGARPPTTSQGFSCL